MTVGQIAPLWFVILCFAGAASVAVWGAVRWALKSSGPIALRIATASLVSIAAVAISAALILHVLAPSAVAQTNNERPNVSGTHSGQVGGTINNNGPTYNGPVTTPPTPPMKKTLPAYDVSGHAEVSSTDVYACDMQVVKASNYGKLTINGGTVIGSDRCLQFPAANGSMHNLSGRILRQRLRALAVQAVAFQAKLDSHGETSTPQDEAEFQTEIRAAALPLVEEAIHRNPSIKRPPPSKTGPGDAFDGWRVIELGKLTGGYPAKGAAAFLQMVADETKD